MAIRCYEAFRISALGLPYIGTRCGVTRYIFPASKGLHSVPRLTDSWRSVIGVTICARYFTTLLSQWAPVSLVDRQFHPCAQLAWAAVKADIHLEETPIAGVLVYRVGIYIRSQQLRATSHICSRTSEFRYRSRWHARILSVRPSADLFVFHAVPAIQ
jgi:hypothetical protein